MYRIILTLGTFLVSFGLCAQQWNEVLKAVSLDREPSELFGQSVALDGNYAVVGSSGNNLDVNGDNFIQDAGAAFVFEKDSDGDWQLTQKLVASDRSSNAQFGFDLSVSGDRMIVSARGAERSSPGGVILSAGAVYVFERDGSTGLWVETQIIQHPDPDIADFFGQTIVLKDDILAVGAPGQDLDGTGSNPLTDAGAVYVFEYQFGSSTWNQTQKLVASDRQANASLGMDLALDSDLLLVGAPNEGYDENGSNFISQAGAAYVFEYAASSWTQSSKLVPPNRHWLDVFGLAVAIGNDQLFIASPLYDYDAGYGNFLSNAGGVFVFSESTPSNWSFSQQLDCSGRDAAEQFGGYLSADEQSIVIGSINENGDVTGPLLQGGGGVYVFDLDAALPGWVESAFVRHADAVAFDSASRCALQDGTLLVGAGNHDFNEIGTYEIVESGAAYIFEYSPDPCTIDSDMDGISDCDETNIYGTNPNDCDSDNDGLTDGLEVNQAGTSPIDPDTDGDGCTDDLEYHLACPDSVCDDCPLDLNEDNMVGTGDLLVLLASFGLVCP